MAISKKNSINSAFLALLLSISVPFLLSCYQKRPEIDIEAVRKDIFTHAKEWIPERHISRLKASMFNTFYLGELCLVHVPYKDYSESSMKSSAVAIYEYQNNTWKYKTIVPYYYKISLIEGSKDYFVSENLFCQPNGDCNSYYEIDRFKDLDFVELKSYSGFDKYNYYSGLLSLDRSNEVTAVIGDTIRHKVAFRDFTFINREMHSFVIEEEFAKLIGVSDTLAIESTKRSRKISL
jgi:hypothetical protein